MEYLINTIKKGAEIEGDQKHLEASIGLVKGNLSDVKAGRRGLPTEACFKLADLTGADVVRLIAESEAITAKAEKAEFWKKKLHELEAMTACLILACVTTVVTPTPAKADTYAQVIDNQCILCKTAWKKIKAFFRQLSTIFAPPVCCAG